MPDTAYLHTDNPAWVSSGGSRVNQSRRAAVKMGWLPAPWGTCGMQALQAEGHVQEELPSGIPTTSPTGKVSSMPGEDILMWVLMLAREGSRLENADLCIDPGKHKRMARKGSSDHEGRNAGVPARP